MSSPPSPMQGVELQIRSHGKPSDAAPFPLSIDRRIAQGDHIRHAKDELIKDLKAIDDFYASPLAPPHEIECRRCSGKKAAIIDAFRKYYLSTDPQAWYHGVPSYQAEMTRLFDHFNEPKEDLDNIHYVFLSGLRDFLKNDLCAPHPRDTDEISNVKNKTAQFYQDAPLNTMNRMIYDHLEEIKRVEPSGAVEQFLIGLQASRTAQGRARVYIAYYCSHEWNDTPQQKNFKLKYSRMFEALVPHDEVVAAMKKEAEEYHLNRVADLRRQLGDQQMAQSAHLKNQVKKAEKAERMRKQEEATLSPVLADCSFSGCPVEVDLTEETVECAICEWLVAKDPASRKRRTYYCSTEHAEEDFDDHDRREHQCCMGEQCLYFPQAGPGGGERPGICQQCSREFADEGRGGQTPFYFFCSESCYKANLVPHRLGFHVSSNQSQYEVLELFRPARDMHIVS